VPVNPTGRVSCRDAIHDNDVVAGPMPLARPSTRGNLLRFQRRLSQAASCFPTPFRSAGRRKQYAVILTDLDPDATARRSQVITHCAWVDRQALSSIHCSRPTPAIVELALNACDDQMHLTPFVDFMIHDEAA
jgi:hypothetical protein